jgi:hypothetical protein
MNQKLSKFPPISSERLSKAMQTVAERYQIEWRFCDKSRTAQTILLSCQDREVKS